MSFKTTFERGIEYMKKINMGILIGIMTLLVGCGDKGATDMTEDIKVTPIQETIVKPTSEVVTPSIEADVSEYDIDMSEHSWLDEAPRRYSPPIRIEGAERDDKLIKVLDEHITFAQFDIVDVEVGTNTLLAKFLDIPQEEVLKIVSLVENAKVLYSESEMQYIGVNEEIYKELSPDLSQEDVASMSIIMETKEGKMAILNLVQQSRQGFQDGVDVLWYYEDQELNEIVERSYLVDSQELSETIRTLAVEEPIDLELLKGNIKVQASRPAYSPIFLYRKGDNSEMIDLDEELTRGLGANIDGLANPIDKCHYVVPLTIICENGQQFNATVFNDRIAIASRTYQITTEFSERLEKFLRENNLIVGPGID